jgi:hypothetical protein
MEGIRLRVRERVRGGAGSGDAGYLGTGTAGEGQLMASEDIDHEGVLQTEHGQTDRHTGAL